MRIKSWACALSFCLTLLFLTATNSATAAVTGLKVGIYSGTGAESSTILALFRAVAAMGHTPMAMTKDDIDGGLLTVQNFDVFVIPPGEDGKKCCAGHYSASDALDQIATKQAIRAYLNSGGGVVAFLALTVAELADAAEPAH